MTQLLLPAQEVLGVPGHCNGRAPREQAGRLYAVGLMDHEFGCQRLPEPVNGPQPLYECGACQYMGHRVTEVADSLVIYVYCVCGEIGHPGDAGLSLRG